jgi:cell division protein FtsB
MRLTILSVILFAVLVFLQYRLWFQQGGVRDMAAMKASLAEQTKETDKLKLSNDDLLFQIKRLQNSKDGAESRARNELGMIKKGETFYHVVK